MTPIAKEDLVSVILEYQVTHLHQQLEAAKREVLQCSGSISSAVASSLSSAPVLLAGSSSGVVGGELSVVGEQLVVRPEPQRGLSIFQPERPAGSHESSRGGGISDGVGGGVNSSGIIGGAVSQREVKGMVDVSTQTQPCIATSQSFDSLYTLQLPGQTDAVWQSEETLVCAYDTSQHRSILVSIAMSPNTLFTCV